MPRLGQGSPLKESWAPSVPPRTLNRFSGSIDDFGIVCHYLCHIAVLVFDHAGHGSVTVLFIEGTGNLLHFLFSLCNLCRVVVAQNVICRCFRNTSAGAGQVIKAFAVLRSLGHFLPVR